MWQSNIKEITDIQRSPAVYQKVEYINNMNVVTYCCSQIPFCPFNICVCAAQISKVNQVIFDVCLPYLIDQNKVSPTHISCHNVTTKMSW